MSRIRSFAAAPRSSTASGAAKSTSRKLATLGQILHSTCRASAADSRCAFLRKPGHAFALDGQLCRRRNVASTASMVQLRNGIGRDHLAEQRHDFWRRDQRAHARACKAIGLRQSAQYHEVRQARELRSESNGRPENSM